MGLNDWFRWNINRSRSGTRDHICCSIRVTTLSGHGKGHGAVLSGDLAAQQLSPHAPHSLTRFLLCVRLRVLPPQLANAQVNGSGRPPLRSGPAGDMPGPLRLKGWLRGSARTASPRGVTDTASPARHLICTGVFSVSQSTQCATLGLAMGPLRSPFEPPSTSPCRAVARLRRAPPSHTPA